MRTARVLSLHVPTFDRADLLPAVITDVVAVTGDERVLRRDLLRDLLIGAEVTNVHAVDFLLVFVVSFALKLLLDRQCMAATV